ASPVNAGPRHGPPLATAAGMTGLVQDLRHAMRQLARTPGFVAVVVLTLALGIGANTSIFSIIRGVLLRPLPYPQPDRLIRIFDRWKIFPRGSVSVPELADFRAQLTQIEQISAYKGGSVSLTGNGPPEQVEIGRG